MLNSKQKMIEKNIVKIEPVKKTRIDIKETLMKIPLGKTAHFYCRELGNLTLVRQHCSMLNKKGAVFNIELKDFGVEYYITRMK